MATTQNAVNIPPEITNREPSIEDRFAKVGFKDNTFKVNYKGQIYAFSQYGWESERGKPVDSETARCLAGAAINYMLSKQNRGVK